MLSVAFLNKELLPAPLRSKTALFTKAVTAALKPFKAKGEVTVVFMKDAAMRKLNKERLGHDYITDVISFPYQENPSPRSRARSAEKLPSPRLRGEGARSAMGEGTPFGDIVICAPQAARQAKELAHSHLKELLTLAVHGALHLVGFDDHKPAAKKKMFKRQDQIVSRLIQFPSPSLSP